MISMREAYEKIGANYDDACARLMGEGMLARFALKFLDDESMDKLEAAMAAGDAEGAFMAAHTLKGVSQNLGFDNLYEPAVVVTEALRGADGVDGAREGNACVAAAICGNDVDPARGGRIRACGP